ncbi:VOC family protein [Mycolicibacterium llatzerense]|uniref:VOC domain-containing protein n=1 Tax=Mycolicibacterium llatzerense TaxID=280871 RepID=A0A0D1LC95_9MYCO|nr:glyoxalase/bleomycin resistance/dioxygenase family protein [Mycolicibacterium llatzerense]KIU15862.1 hypothetical protein TL10_16275 [Mycolicibacterium llatzerense]
MNNNGLETGRHAPPVPRGFSVCQIAVSTSDLAGSLRLFDNLFGFRNAGGSALWGQAMRVTGLSRDARAVVWWLVGEQPFLQLELFEYTHPVPAPIGAPGEAGLYGWVRIGIAVADFSRVKDGLLDFNIEPLIPPMGPVGARSLSFREPFAGFVIEVNEAPNSEGPQVRYATQAVHNIDMAARLHNSVLGATMEPLAPIAGGRPARWPAGSGEPNGFLARYDEFVIEVLQYPDGPTTPPQQRRIYDHGIINLALGTRDFSTAADLIERLQADGHRSTEVVQNEQIVGTYFVDPGCEFEVFSLPEEYDNMLGFCATTPFVANMGF